MCVDCLDEPGGSLVTCTCKCYRESITFATSDDMFSAVCVKCKHALI
jgi:hypothetical protein